MNLVPKNPSKLYKSKSDSFFDLGSKSPIKKRIRELKKTFSSYIQYDKNISFQSNKEVNTYFFRQKIFADERKLSFDKKYLGDRRSGKLKEFTIEKKKVKTDDEDYFRKKAVLKLFDKKIEQKRKKAKLGKSNEKDVVTTPL